MPDKPGRPTKYNQEFHPPFANALARLGRTDEEIANELSITRSTLALWKKNHSEFSDALKKAKEEPDNKVEQSLYRRAVGFEYDEVTDDDGRIKTTRKLVAPDVTAQIFWLKNRRPAQWRDKRELELPDGFTGVIHVPPKMDGEKWSKQSQE
jgi:hypothetical protein